MNLFSLNCDAKEFFYKLAMYERKQNNKRSIVPPQRESSFSSQCTHSQCSLRARL